VAAATAVAAPRAGARIRARLGGGRRGRLVLVVVEAVVLRDEQPACGGEVRCGELAQLRAVAVRVRVRVRVKG